MMPATIAASLAGLVALGALLSPPEPRSAVTAAVPAVYSRATGELEAILRTSMTGLRPETVKALEASLTAIDSAIAQAERALATDPANDYVSRALDQLRDARLTVLRRAVSAATSEEV
jgi:hypothetical protein